MSSPERSSDLHVQELVSDFTTFGVSQEAVEAYARDRESFIEREGSERCFEFFLGIELRGVSFECQRPILEGLFEDPAQLDSTENTTLDRIGYVAALVGRFHVHLLVLHEPHRLVPDLTQDTWHFGASSGRGRIIFVSSFSALQDDQHDCYEDHNTSSSMDLRRGVLCSLLFL